MHMNHTQIAQLAAEIEAAERRIAEIKAEIAELSKPQFNEVFIHSTNWVGCFEVEVVKHLPKGWPTGRHFANNTDVFEMIEQSCPAIVRQGKIIWIATKEDGVFNFVQQL